MRRATLLSLCLLAASPVYAQQVTESAGTQALGMGGAFVGVADDATATFWNPAGLATGGPAGFTLERNTFSTGDAALLGTGQTRRHTTFATLGALPVGLSYMTSSQSYLVAGPSDTLRTQSLRTSVISTTLLQTLVPGLVVGATLKYVRGTVVAADAVGTTTDAVFDHADALSGSSSGAVDLDLAAMVDAKYIRVGVTARNVRQPTFSDGAGTEMSLPRQTRAGVAILPGYGLTLALDLDLDTVDLPDGPRRMLAFGGEQRIGKRLVARSGVRVNRVGASNPAGSFGGSVMVQPHLWLDAHYTTGGVFADRGFGAALRAGF